MTDTELAVRPSNPAASPGDVRSIVGWGVDANPENDPTYPYRDRSADDHNGEWRRPPRQQSEVEILQSVEHKQRPAVFGTSTPPRFISGTMRRQAFRWSESNWAHWLILLGADRVNMIEGLIEDVARLRIHEVPKEMGIRAEWKHNKKGLAAKVAILGATIGGIYAWRRVRSSRPARPDDGSASKIS